MLNVSTTVLLIIILLVVLLGPFITIWGLNTLFPVLAIPYGFKTWLAVLVVKGFIATKITQDKK